MFNESENEMRRLLWMMAIGVALAVPASSLAGDVEQVAPVVRAQKWMHDEGSVAVMNNGTILVHFDYGDTFILDPSRDVSDHALYWSRLPLTGCTGCPYCDGWAHSGDHCWTTGASWRPPGNGWHIDEARGSPRDKGTWRFTDAESHAPEPLLELGGLVLFKVNMGDEPTITVSVEGEQGNFFHEFQLDQETSPFDARYGMSNAPASYVGENGTVANDTGSTCSVECSHGSITVNCPGKRGCFAYCSSNGEPHGGCGTRTLILP
jgi:hypothetical protein